MRYLLPCLLALALLSSCTAAPVPKDAPAPTCPQLAVWVADADALVQMDAEAYVAGVLAGEMPSSWPMEALKAQAILARTFVMKFTSEKESMYPGADVSTDVTEAQAYDAAAIDGRILAAVNATRGMVLLTDEGALPYAWFHAHSGGTTALAREALDWRGEEPAHTRVTRGMESADAPDAARCWSAAFTADAFLAACREAGYPLASCRQVAIGETGPSGRAVTLLVDGVAVNAARLRISLGSTRMRSTLLTELTAAEGVIHMSGLGYGHGVGLSQWGARALAEAGWTAEKILLHYYTGLHLHQAW